MKKTMMTAALVLMIAPEVVKAQDTVVSAFPASNCYYSSWPSEKNVACWWGMPQNYGGLLKVGKYFYTEDTLAVYGFALAMGYDEQPGYQVESNSLANVYEYMGIYKHEADTFRLEGDTLCAHLETTPVAYYFRVDRDAPEPFGNRTHPVYEVYYDSPLQVVDSFYICLSQRSWDPRLADDGGYLGVFGNRPLNILAYGYYPYEPMEGRMVLFREDWDGQRYYLFWDANNPMYLYEDLYLFPILSPYTPDTTQVNPGDTTVVDTTGVDTLGISVQLLERHVSLMPNPATERVQVVSSFGLRGVEVYNAAGAKVEDRRLTGISASLDVSALPEGAYVVKVRTPAGTAVKKLLVSRR